MIRTTIIPDKRTVNISFSIPEDYIGKEMEVIAFTKKEGVEILPVTSKTVSFTAISVDTRGFKFDRDEANRR